MVDRTCQSQVQNNHIEVEVWTTPNGYKLAFFDVCNKCKLLSPSVPLGQGGEHDWSYLEYHSIVSEDYRSRITLQDKPKVRQTTFEVE